jgi:hypothetical protein
MCSEARTVLRDVVPDIFLNCWCLEISLENGIRHVPMCVCNHAKNFGLEAFQDFYIGNGSHFPEFYPGGPHWFDCSYV